MKLISNGVKRFGLALAILVMALLFTVSLFLLPSGKFSETGNFSGGNWRETEEIPKSPVPEKNNSEITKLSEVRGPSIGGEAAATARQENIGSCPLPSKTIACQTLPPEIWIFLLVVYLFLLIFNLGATFGKRDTVQWTWEAVYTMLALGVWFWQDQCRTNLWFPLFVIALGIMIYLFYLYFFDNRLGRIQKQGIRKGNQTKLDF